MNSISKRSLFVVLALVLAVAGVAWAAQPVTPTTPELDAEVSQPVIDAELEELFLDPQELGACCFAECWEVWGVCVEGCNGDTACRQACTADRRECTSHC
ncbi:MAG: hypothetical protein PVG07_11385 [Acidobacteriota bacterium]|jgi:hypothetical protein